MKQQYSISKILLPIDGSEHSKRAVRFTGYLGAAMGDALTNISLLRAGRELHKPSSVVH